MATTRKLRLSATQVSMYVDKCPRQYAFRYIEGKRLPPSGAMTRGIVGHDVIAHNYRQKARGKGEQPVDTLMDMFADAWKLELGKQEVVFEEDEKPQEMRDEGIAAVKEHRVKISPHVMPLAEKHIEEWFDLPLVSKSSGSAEERVEYSLIGKIDLIDRDKWIRDNKIVSARRYVSSEIVARDPQLSLYSIAYRIIHKEAEAGVSQDVVRMMKAGPQALQIPGVRTREFLIEQLNTVGHVARGIEHHVFPRRTDGWWCSKKWCGYWGICMGKNLKVVDVGQNLEKDLKASIDADQVTIRDGDAAQGTH